MKTYEITSNASAPVPHSVYLDPSQFDDLRKQVVPALVATGMYYAYDCEPKVTCTFLDKEGNETELYRGKCHLYEPELKVYKSGIELTWKNVLIDRYDDEDEFSIEINPNVP